MVNVVLPVYKGKKFLKIALDSLVEQKYKDFILSFIQDYDKEDYTDIINEYSKKIKIDYVKSEVRIRQGQARQIGIDRHPECDYVMFLDQDDSYLPTTIDTLYSTAKENNYDLVCSCFLVEPNEVRNKDNDFLTFLHGKIYSTNYLKKINLTFKKDLKYAEDAYFNLIAYYCTNNKFFIEDEVTYIWKNNIESETRKPNNSEYYLNMFNDYIIGTIEALEKIMKINTCELSAETILFIIMQFYEASQILEHYNYNSIKSKEYLVKLGKMPKIKKLFNENSNWIFLLMNIKSGEVIEDDIIFYKTDIKSWIETWLER